MMKTKVIFVDVDDTLIRSVGRTRIPIPAAIAAVRRLQGEGAMLYLWSSGGADYACESASFSVWPTALRLFCPNRMPRIC